MGAIIEYNAGNSRPFCVWVGGRSGNGISTFESHKFTKKIQMSLFDSFDICRWQSTVGGVDQLCCDIICESHARAKFCLYPEIALRKLFLFPLVSCKWIQPCGVRVVNEAIPWSHDEFLKWEPLLSWFTALLSSPSENRCCHDLQRYSRIPRVNQTSNMEARSCHQIGQR